MAKPIGLKPIVLAPPLGVPGRARARAQRLDMARPCNGCVTGEAFSAASAVARAPRPRLPRVRRASPATPLRIVIALSESRHDAFTGRAQARAVAVESQPSSMRSEEHTSELQPLRQLVCR